MTRTAWGIGLIVLGLVLLAMAYTGILILDSGLPLPP